MSVIIPESHRYLLADPICATVTTVFEDGQPQASVIWTKLVGDTIQFSTLANRQKTKNMEHNPKLSIVAIDPQQPFRYIEVRGIAEISYDHAIDLIEELSMVYTGRVFYGDVAPIENKGKEPRIIVSVKPLHVVIHGNIDT